MITEWLSIIFIHPWGSSWEKPLSHRFRPYQTRIRSPFPCTWRLQKYVMQHWKESGDPCEIGWPKKLPPSSKHSIDPPPPTLNAWIDFANIVALQNTKYDYVSQIPIIQFWDMLFNLNLFAHCGCMPFILNYIMNNC